MSLDFADSKKILLAGHGDRIKLSVRHVSVCVMSCILSAFLFLHGTQSYTGVGA